MTRREAPVELNQLSQAVIGAAIDVHRELGPGFIEVVYEEALCHELELRGILFERQKEVNVKYKGHPVGEGRLDILVANRLIVELKAVDTLLPIHKAQVISYFNVPVLKDGVQRIVLS